MGFLSAFGYWISAILGNTFYWVLIGATLGQFFPRGLRRRHQRGLDRRSLVGVWAFHFLILRGVKEATFINKIVTVAKIVPLILAILIFVFFFNYSQFSENFFGGVGMPEKSLIMQVRDTMLITVFVFLGIEGASVYSRYAKKRSDIGAATILGFLAVTGLMVAITLLPYATAPRSAISGVANPSLAGALELVAGHWGAVMIIDRRPGLGARRLSRLDPDHRRSGRSPRPNPRTCRACLPRRTAMKCPRPRFGSRTSSSRCSSSRPTGRATPSISCSTCAA